MSQGDLFHGPCELRLFQFDAEHFVICAIYMTDDLNAGTDEIPRAKIATISFCD